MTSNPAAGQPHHVEDLPAFSRTRGFNLAIATLITPLLAD